MPLGLGAIAQLTKLVAGIPQVLQNIPTIARDPIAMFGTIAAKKELAELQAQLPDADTMQKAVSDKQIEIERMPDGPRKTEMLERLNKDFSPKITEQDALDLAKVKAEQLKPALLPALAPISTLFGFPVPLTQLMEFLQGSDPPISLSESDSNLAATQEEAERRAAATEAARLAAIAEADRLAREEELARLTNEERDRRIAADAEAARIAAAAAARGRSTGRSGRRTGRSGGYGDGGYGDGEGGEEE